MEYCGCNPFKDKELPLRKSSLIVSWLSIVLIIGNTLSSEAQISLRGGRGLLRVQDGETAEKGDLYLSAFGSTFLKKQPGFGHLLKDYHLSLNATYGLTNSLEFSTRFVAYQDDQVHIWGPIGDTEIGMKLKLPLGEQRTFNFSLRNYLILPTGAGQNLQFEPFTTDNVGWSGGMASSLDLQNFFLTPLKLYLNGGYIDRNTGDELFTSEIDQVYWGGGLKFLIKNTILFWEYYTEQFFNRTDEVTFSENYQVSSQGVAFLGPQNLVFTIASDINLARPTDKTFFVPKELAHWKIWIGISKHIPLKKMLHEMAEKERNEKKLQEELRKQQEIKKQRTEAEQELKRMQELLKKQKKNKEDKS